MLEATHRRIAREIARQLNLNQREANLLEVGSVSPDSWANFPHHEGKEEEIVDSILEARRLYIQKDDECFARLGNALHYIADRWTLRPRLGDKHTQYEHTINSLPILDDEQLEEEIHKPVLPTKAEQAYLAFLEVLKKGVFHPSISEEIKTPIWPGVYAVRTFPTVKGSGGRVVNYALQNRPTTWSSPILDLNIAYRVCLEVALNVFSQEHDKEDWMLSESDWMLSEQDPVKIHREGTAQYDRGDYNEAIGKFLQSSQLYKKVGNFFDASYMMFKAAECSFLLKDYETAIERFLKSADIALEKGYDRFGLSALEYAHDCLKAAGKEKDEKATNLKKRIAEVKKKLEAQAF